MFCYAIQKGLKQIQIILGLLVVILSFWLSRKDSYLDYSNSNITNK